MESPVHSSGWCPLCEDHQEKPLSALGPRTSPEILLGSYPMTFITSQVPLCFNDKEAKSPNLTHSHNCTLSEHFMNWFYLILLSSLSFAQHFLIHFLPLSHYTVGLSEKPCRKQSREMVPKLCRTLGSLKNL